MLCLLLEEWSRSLNKTDPTVLKTPPLCSTLVSVINQLTGSHATRRGDPNLCEKKEMEEEISPRQKRLQEILIFNATRFYVI